MFSKTMQRNRVALLAIAVLSFISALFLHSMVYGVDLVIPSTYSLFAPDHRPLILIGLVHQSPLGGDMVVDHVVSVLIHLAAPQVVLGIGVAGLALRARRRHE